MWGDAQRAAFNWWAGTEVDWEPRAVAKHALLYQLAASAISFASDRIKKQVYRDKQAFLQGLAADGLYNVGQILQKLKQHGVGGRKNKNKRLPLPKLNNVDGAPPFCSARVW